MSAIGRVESTPRRHERIYVVKMQQGETGLTLNVGACDDLRDEVQYCESAERDENRTRLIVQSIHSEDHDEVYSEIGDGESAICR